MLRTRNWLEALIVCRSRLAQATLVLEQGFVTAHACAGAALVPIAVPERRVLVLHDAGTPSSDWRHDLATGCHSVATHTGSCSPPRGGVPNFALNTAVGRHGCISDCEKSHLGKMPQA